MYASTNAFATLAAFTGSGALKLTLITLDSRDGLTSSKS